MHPKIKTTRHLLAAAAATLTVLQALSAAARAGAYVTVDSQERVAGSPSTFPRYNTTTNPPISQPTSDSFAYDGAVIDVRASATLGVNRIYEEINVTRYTDTADYGFIAAKSFWEDNLTIGKAGQTGTGTFSASVDVTGTFAETARDVEFANINLSAALAVNGRTAGLSFNDQSLPATLNQRLTLTNVPFTFGTPFQISVELILAAGKEGFFLNSGSARFVGDLGNSVTWQGVADVMDAQGNPVTGYSATGASGTDYSQPIPEPATALLTALALGAFAGQRPRRSVG